MTMTGGDITVIEPHEQSISLRISSETQLAVLTISPTNYKLSVGDYISWNEKKAFWRSQHCPEREIQLFVVSVVTKTK